MKNISNYIFEVYDLTKEYMDLDDDLSNATRYSQIRKEVEEIAMKICMLNTDLTEDELIDFLDSHYIQ